jgi:hypothetical protein
LSLRKYLSIQRQSCVRELIHSKNRQLGGIDQNLVHRNGCRKPRVFRPGRNAPALAIDNQCQ